MIKLPKHNCLRCGHTWIPRTEEIPKVCPKCKSPYWNKRMKYVDRDLSYEVRQNADKELRSISEKMSEYSPEDNRKSLEMFHWICFKYIDWISKGKNKRTRPRMMRLSFDVPEAESEDIEKRLQKILDSFKKNLGDKDYKRSLKALRQLCYGIKFN